MVQEKYCRFANLNISLYPIIMKISIGQNMVDHPVHSFLQWLNPQKIIGE